MSRSPQNSRSARAGMGLVELAISTVILVLVMGAAVILGTSTTEAYGTASAEAQLDASVSRAISLCADRLRGARAETLALVAGPGTCVLDFEVAVDYDELTGDITWRRDRLAFDEEPGEPVDGFDDDGDGLVDEGRIVYVRDVGGPGESQVVLATGVARAGGGETPGNGTDDDGDGLVDEPGFNLELAGGAVLVELTLQASLRGGRLGTRTIRRTMGPRN